jgi:hypothetical protein
MIRLRLPEERRRPEPEPNPLLTLFGLSRKQPPPASHIMELHMQNKLVDKRNLLEITVVMLPEEGQPHTKKHFPEKVCRELRAYLMGH